MPPLPADAPNIAAEVEGAEAEEVEVEDAGDSDTEVPPPRGRHQHESSSSQRALSPPRTTPRTGESSSLAATTVLGGGSSSAILLDDDDEDDDLPAGTKRSRPSGNSTKAAEALKRNKRAKASEEIVPPAPLRPLRVELLSSAPPRDSTVPGGSPRAVPNTAKLRFRSIPR